MICIISIFLVIVFSSVVVCCLLLLPLRGFVLYFLVIRCSYFYPYCDDDVLVNVLIIDDAIHS